MLPLAGPPMDRYQGLSNRHWTLWSRHGDRTHGPGQGSALRFGRPTGELFIGSWLPYIAGNCPLCIDSGGFQSASCLSHGRWTCSEGNAGNFENSRTGTDLRGDSVVHRIGNFRPLFLWIFNVESRVWGADFGCGSAPSRIPKKNSLQRSLLRSTIDATIYKEVPI